MVIDRMHILHNLKTDTYHPVAVVLLEIEGHTFPDNHSEHWVLHQEGFPSLREACEEVEENLDFVHVQLHLDEALPWDGDLASLGRVPGEHQA